MNKPEETARTKCKKNEKFQKLNKVSDTKNIAKESSGRLSKKKT